MPLSISISNSIASQNTTASKGFVWANIEAETYYNAVTIANGGDIDTITLYGQTLDDTKSAIDSRVTSLKSAGVFSKLIHDYPFFGGTADTHAINAVNAASTLLYFGSPTHSNLGMITNGANQYASLNNSFRSEVPSSEDWAIGVDTNSSNSKIMMGSRDATNIAAVIRYRLSTLIGYTTTAGFTVSPAISSVNDSFIVASQYEPFISRLYNDAVEKSVTSASSGFIPTTYPLFIGAWNNYGGVIDAVAGNHKFAFASSGLTPAEVSSINTINNTFQSFLGR